MATLRFGDCVYEVDSSGFLRDFRTWNKHFAEGMAPSIGISEGLTHEHWKVIRFIRSVFHDQSTCPLVYQTCRMNNLMLSDLKRLFPAGYLRGACKLAGITYREAYVGLVWLPESVRDPEPSAQEKTYRVDTRGFLVDQNEWDEQFAIFKSQEMKMPEKLTAKHWQVIHFLRDSYAKNVQVPTIFETCKANGIDIDELERLFPDGYHRGAVKIAGLRVL